MQILMVNEKGWFFGGVEQLVNDLAIGLGARGHRVGLLSTEGRPDGREALSAPFTTTACVDPTASPEAWRRQVDAMLDQIEPDVVFTHRLAARALVPLAERCAVVRYVHDHDLYCPRRHKYFPVSLRVCTHPMGLHCLIHGCLVTRSGPLPGLPWFVDPFAKRRELQANRRLKHLCVGSHWMREMMITNGFHERQVSVVPPVPRGLERPPIPIGEEPVVLFVGQLIRGKGVDLLLRALTLVRCRFRAVIVGSGNHEGACMALARELGLGDRVCFVGWVPHDRLDRHYEQARVVAVPSRWPEPFGMVGLEAMWASRPVVGFEVGGIPDWLSDRESGFLVPAADWRAFGQALERLLGDRELAEAMGRQGRRVAAESFRFSDLVRTTETVLESAAAAGESKAGAGGTEGQDERERRDPENEP